jgi:hypothetical protein
MGFERKVVGADVREEFVCADVILESEDVFAV